jgi:hypothetical protein
MILEIGKLMVLFLVGRQLVHFTGVLGHVVSSSGLIFSQTLSSIYTSTLSSMSMSALSSGQISPSTNFGVASFSYDEREWSWIAKKGNTLLENFGYLFGGLSNIQDIATSFSPGNYEYQYEKTKGQVGHGNIRKIDPTQPTNPVIISVANRNSVSVHHDGIRGVIEYAWKAQFDKYTGGPEYWLSVPEAGPPRIPLTMNNKALSFMQRNLTKNRGLLDIDKTKFKINYGCVSYSARALWYTGIPTIPIINYLGPNVLYYQLIIRQIGIYAAPYSNNF